MSTELVAGSPWPAIRRVCRSRGPRSAAVAYVGSDAPDLLRLRRGDVLVVNAGRSALLAHATDPEALAAYLAGGVRVYSHTRLHAKVVATSSWAVVGSANASRNSTTLVEAAIVSDDPGIVADVHGFVEGLVVDEQIDEAFLKWARGVWAAGKGGMFGGSPAGPGSPPARVERVLLFPYEEGWLSKSEEAAARQASKGARRGRGLPREKYVRDIAIAGASNGLRGDDVVCFVGTDEGDAQHLYPPALVIGSPTPVRARDQVAFTYLLPAEREPVDLGDARRAVREAGGRLPRGSEAVWVTASKSVDALLALWPLAEEGRGDGEGIDVGPLRFHTGSSSA